MTVHADGIDTYRIGIRSVKGFRQLTRPVDRWFRTWQAEWETCRTAPRAWTEAGVLRKARRWRRNERPEHSSERAMRLARAGDWRGRRFLEASEQLTDIETALYQAFAKEGDINVDLLNAVDAIADAHQAVSRSSTAAEEDA